MSSAVLVHSNCWQERKAAELEAAALQKAEQEGAEQSRREQHRKADVFQVHTTLSHDRMLDYCHDRMLEYCHDDA